jgi:hypothetical protein
VYVGLWVKGGRGKTETTGYEPFAAHAPVQWAFQGECDQEHGVIGFRVDQAAVVEGHDGRPAPYTLHPTSYTLHPAFCTQNPKPRHLHPESSLEKLTNSTFGVRVLDVRLRVDQAAVVEGRDGRAQV